MVEPPKLIPVCFCFRMPTTLFIPENAQHTLFASPLTNGFPLSYLLDLKM